MLLPYAIEIETSTYCNRSCKWCPNAYYERSHRQDIMPLNAFKEIITTLKRISFAGEISLHGYNEPLLDPLIYERLKIIRDDLPATKLILVSNGDSLDSTTFSKLLRIGIDMIRISIYDDQWTIDPDLIIAASEEKYPKILLCRTLRGEEVVFNLGKTILVYFLQKKASFTSRGGSIPNKYTDKASALCTRPFTRCVIDVNGDMKVCCEVFSGLDMHRQWGIVGNVFKEGVLQVWWGTNMNILRNMLLVGNNNNPICSKCSMPDWTEHGEIESCSRWNLFLNSPKNEVFDSMTRLYK